MIENENTPSEDALSDNPELTPEADIEQAGEQVIDEVGQLREQLADAEDRALRVQAEAQNMIRRAERDIENARKYALEKFSAGLLPVIDNLERALQAMGDADDKVKPLLEGVELTHRSFIDVLTKFDVVEVDPTGSAFDPELHQAMSMIETPDAPPNTVVAVMQKGYTLNGRLIRPAMVVVSKGGSPSIDETA